MILLFLCLLIFFPSTMAFKPFPHWTLRYFPRSLICFHRQSFRVSSTVNSLPVGDSGSSMPALMQKNFISNIIEEDLRTNKHGGKVLTRFPPEPNGYLHIGHAKSIFLNFAVAKLYNGVTNMRFDDTNPEKENIEYINSILEDVRWIETGRSSVSSSSGDPWDGPVRYASNYFPVIYKAAEYLIKNGLAYVDHLTNEEIKLYRGTLSEPGKNSPHRNRSIEENLHLFESMKRGEFSDGHCVLRAKIDMSSPNVNMRDPTLYRIKHFPHPMTGSEWCIYPMYDFAHAISDALEGITHSLCTLEFAEHRPLYDWTVDNLMNSGLFPSELTSKGYRPYQYEFSRLNIQHTVLSKRKLIQLVQEKHVQGWDDPRMPTISGLRRRGYTSDIIKMFCYRIGVSKSESNFDYSVLEDCAREILDEQCSRAFAIENPLKISILNRPDEVEEIQVENHPKKPELGTRKLPFTSSLFIDRDDFFDTGIDGKTPPPKGFKRLLLGSQVRLKFAYVITCEEVVRDPITKEVIELRCRYHSDTKSGNTPTGMKKVRGIIQWLSSANAIPVKFHLYDRLFRTPVPGYHQPDGNFLKDLNENSLRIISEALLESSVIHSVSEESLDKESLRYQFERLGYFLLDKKDSNLKEKSYIFNRIVTLRDGWSENKTSP
jgi:glutaminyl-tRNA synthetase